MVLRPDQGTRPHVLYVIGQLRRGGSEQQLYHLLRRLDHKATIVSMYSGGYWARPIRDLGHEVIELGAAIPFEPGRIRKIHAAITDRAPDIVHVLHTGMHGLYAQAAAKLAGHSRVIVNVRSDPLRLPRPYRWVWGALTREAAAIVCNNRRSRSRIRALGLAPADRLHLIPNGIDPGRFRPEPTRGGSRSGDRGCAVITVTRLERVKNPAMLLYVARKVSTAFPEARFVIVGNGPMRRHMNRLASRLEIADRMSFRGETDDVAPLLRAADLFVLTSNYEGSPNAILEAMACELPCVSTDAGGCSEAIVHGKTGLIVPVGDIDAMTTAVLQLLRQNESRRAMGRSGRHHVEREYGVERMVDRYRDLYRDLLGS